MPVYEHKCQNEECNEEWTLEYSIKKDPPTTCPKCLKETAIRLISLGARGKVELYGQDLVDKVKGETQQLKKDIYSSEKQYASFLGEAKYQQIQQRLDKQKKK